VSEPTRRRLLVASAAWPLVARAAASAPGNALALPAVELLDGGRIEVGDWAARPAVVVFWATHCPFCKRHNAHVDKLHRLQANAGAAALRVLGVALDSDAAKVRHYMAANGYAFPVALDDDAAAVRRYMAGNGYAFPVALDGGRLRPLFTSRQVIPMTCALERGARLLQAWPGEMFEEDVLELPQLLAPRAG